MCYTLKFSFSSLALLFYLSKLLHVAFFLYELHWLISRTTRSCVFLFVACYILTDAGSCQIAFITRTFRDVFHSLWDNFSFFFFLVVAHLMNDFFAPYNSSLLGFSLYLINWWKNWSFKDVTLKDGEFLFLKNNSECCSWGCSAFVGCRPWCSKDVLRCLLGFHIVLSFRMWNHVMPVYDPPPGHKWLKKKTQI